VLAFLLGVATLPPFVARALHSPVGDFAMFTRIDRYRLELSVLGPSGREAITRAELAPHLSRDAQLVVLPVGGDGFGSDQGDLLASGLGDLGRLLCELRPQAHLASVRLGRAAFARPEFTWRESLTDCSGAR